MPSVSPAQIERAKNPAQLEKLYWQAEADFVNEWQPATADVILAYCEGRRSQGGGVAITALTLTLQPEKNRIVVSITDDAGNTADAYASLQVGCLAPFDMLCGRLGHRTHKRVKALAQKYLPGGAMDGALARPYRFDAVLEGGYPRTPQGAGA